MATYHGVVRRSDLEGGSWELHADGGEVYQLDGGGADLLKDGTRAEIVGRVDGGSFGLAMRGQVLKIERYAVR